MAGPVRILKVGSAPGPDGKVKVLVTLKGNKQAMMELKENLSDRLAKKNFDKDSEFYDVTGFSIDNSGTTPGQYVLTVNTNYLNDRGVSLDNNDIAHWLKSLRELDCSVFTTTKTGVVPVSGKPDAYFPAVRVGLNRDCISMREAAQQQVDIAVCNGILQRKDMGIESKSKPPEIIVFDKSVALQRNEALSASSDLMSQVAEKILPASRYRDLQ